MIPASPRSEQDLREALHESTEDLRAALEELELRARWEVSLGRRFAEHAPAVLLVAFLVGLMLGAATGGRSRRL